MIFEISRGRISKSIDPETYLSTIPPQKFVMIQSANDTIIDYESAKQTFSKARAPKELHTVTCEMHGYCAEVADVLKTELEGFFWGISTVTKCSRSR
jgi:fermentation-respiration switch protein FrsA (DUF1100 family)